MGTGLYDKDGGENGEEMTRLESNKLIDKFNDIPEWPKEVPRRLNAPEYNNYYDWNMLMRVIERIESKGYTVRIFPHTFTIHDRLKLLAGKAKGTGTKLDMVYKGVVEFINWYNKQKR